MGRMFSRFVATLGGRSTIDGRVAFEVQADRIVAYSVTESGLFRRKRSYEPTGELPISRDTLVELWCRVEPGSGMVDVRTGNDSADFHVYGEAEAFVAAVKQAVAEARR